MTDDIKTTVSVAVPKRVADVFDAHLEMATSKTNLWVGLGVGYAIAGLASSGTVFAIGALVYGLSTSVPHDPLPHGIGIFITAAYLAAAFVPLAIGLFVKRYVDRFRAAYAARGLI